MGGHRPGSAIGWFEPPPVNARCCAGFRRLERPRYRSYLGYTRTVLAHRGHHGNGDPTGGVMFRKEWSAEFRGHRISVENAWGLGIKAYGGVPLPAFPSSIKLYIDGECVDTTSDAWGSKRRPLLRGRIVDREQVFVVEAYVWSGAVSTKAKIVVNGQELPTAVR